MNIRDEDVDDINAIYDLVKDAFGQNAEAELVAKLRLNNDSVISLVAEEDGKILEHVLFLRMTAPSNTLGLGPVAVSPHRQKSGIGTRLIQQGLQCARSAGWQAVFVLGEPEYYERFGFAPESAKKFQSPYSDPYFMALELGKNAFQAMSKQASYASPFPEFD